MKRVLSFAAVLILLVACTRYIDRTTTVIVDCPCKGGPCAIEECPCPVPVPSPTIEPTPGPTPTPSPKPSPTPTPAPTPTPGPSPTPPPTGTCFYNVPGSDGKDRCMSTPGYLSWNASNHLCELPFPGVSAKGFNLNPGQSDPNCLRK